MTELYKDYVCPTCYNLVDNCSCDLRPYHLIMIDRGIQEHIRVLRNKGYITVGCCESHHEVCLVIYIAFAKDYGFGKTISLPDGFKYNKTKRSIVYNYNKKLSMEEIEIEKKIRLNQLLEWCKQLPNNN